MTTPPRTGSGPATALPVLLHGPSLHTSLTRARDSFTRPAPRRRPQGEP
jgi:hypothetical protein